MSDTIEMVQGDLLPILSLQAVGLDKKTPVPITGKTYKLHIKNRSGVHTKDYEIVDEELGTFQFTWVKGDTDEVGTYKCEIEEFDMDNLVDTIVIDPDTLLETTVQLPKNITTSIFYIKVRKQLA